MDEPLLYLVSHLLHQNQIPYDKEELKFQIESHPSYPSLHAITGVLNHFNIDNLALNVPIDKNTLTQLPNTFLAQLKTEKDNAFAVVTNIGVNYQVVISKKEKKKLTINAFLEEFTGIMVAVEKTEDTIVSKNKSKPILLVLAIIAALSASFLLFSAGIGTLPLLYFFVTLLGIYVSYALVRQELGESSLLGNVFCSSENTQTNCNKVLTSKGAQVGSYKLSDISMSFFVGFTLATFLLVVTKNTITPLHVISILAIPVTLYSIYYQYAVVKEWCLLCLSIVGVLWLQAGFSFFNIDTITTFISDINLNSLLIISISFLSAFVIWNVVSSRSKQIKKLTESKLSLIHI